MSKNKKMSKSSKPASKSAKTSKTVKALYPVSRLTKNSSANLWVTFPAGKTSKGLVYSSTLTRDAVRNSARKAFGVNITAVRSRRVSNFRKMSK